MKCSIYRMELLMAGHPSGFDALRAWRITEPPQSPYDDRDGAQVMLLCHQKFADILPMLKYSRPDTVRWLSIRRIAARDPARLEDRTTTFTFQVFWDRAYHLYNLVAESNRVPESNRVRHLGFIPEQLRPRLRPSYFLAECTVTDPRFG